MYKPSGRSTIELQTIPSDTIFRSAEQSVHTPYLFDQVVGVVLGRNGYGNEGTDSRSLEVPTKWAKRLVKYFNSGVATANCHAFSDFMTGGDGDTIAPNGLIVPERRLSDTQTQPDFGERLLLGILNTRRKTPRVDSIGQTAAPRHAAYHSAIALGDTAPGEAIQVTTQGGFLAIDSLARLAEHVDSVLNPNPSDPVTDVDRVEWFTAS